MLDALEEREKREEEGRKLIREALRHPPRVVYSVCSLEDSAQSDALLLDDALLARLEEPSSSAKSEDQNGSGPCLDFASSRRPSDDKAKEKLARQKRKEAREKLRSRRK